MKRTNVFDLFFTGDVDIVEVRTLRIELAKRIHKEESVDIDRQRWDYACKCLMVPLRRHPTALNSFILLFCISQHPSLQNVVRKQFLANTGSYNHKKTGKSAELFFGEYVEFLVYCRDDFISSDPFKTAELWPKSFNMMRYVWDSKMIQRPWNSVMIRSFADMNIPKLKKRGKGRTAAAKKVKISPE